MVISPDSLLYTPEGRYYWTVPRVKQAWADSKQEYARCLASGTFTRVVLLMGIPAAGKSTWLAANHEDDVLYFDAMFDLPFKREPYIRLARAAGVPVEIVWLDTPLSVCIERNTARAEDRRVPEAVLRATQSKIADKPPTEAEGATVTRITYGGAA